MRDGNTFIKGMIKDRKGETIIESLAAILIAVLSLSILAMVIISSGRITSDSTAAMKEYHEANSAVSARSEAQKLDGTGTLKLTGESGETCYFTADPSGQPDVTYYANDESRSVPVVAYELDS